MWIELKIIHQVGFKPTDQYPEGFIDDFIEFRFNSFESCLNFIKIFQENVYDCVRYEITQIDE